MEITFEKIDRVIEETGVEYKDAKAALIHTDGDVEAAIAEIKGVKATGSEFGEDVQHRIDEVIAKIKEKVKEGNVDKIQLKKDDEIVLSIPVNVGVVGGLFGLAVAPWAMIAAGIAAYGLSCKIEIVKKDNSSEEL